MAIVEEAPVKCNIINAIKMHFHCILNVIHRTLVVFVPIPLADSERRWRINIIHNHDRVHVHTHMMPGRLAGRRAGQFEFAPTYCHIFIAKQIINIETHCKFEKQTGTFRMELTQCTTTYDNTQCQRIPMSKHFLFTIHTPNESFWI